MAILDPDSLHVVLRFVYRNCKVEIDQREEGTTFVAWVHHEWGCAIAAQAPSKAIAIRQAKDWVDRKRNNQQQC